MSETLADKLEELLEEVWRVHRDPDDFHYNECEKPGEECAWCAETKEILAALRAQGGGEPAAKALKDLVDALDRCDKDITNVFAFYSVHGFQYDGETYHDELEAARAALLAHPSETEAPRNKRDTGESATERGDSRPSAARQEDLPTESLEGATLAGSPCRHFRECGPRSNVCMCGVLQHLHAAPKPELCGCGHDLERHNGTPPGRCVTQILHPDDAVLTGRSQWCLCSTFRAAAPIAQEVKEPEPKKGLWRVLDELSGTLELPGPRGRRTRARD